MKSIGATMREQRKARGLTQQQVAELARLPRSEISEMENNKFTGSIIRVERAAAALGMCLVLQVKRWPVLEELHSFFNED
ncbi:helix-turn-helix domain-containing protein [Marinobacter bryozoorum]|nr:helix-turn-helix transcriptional regulator [Marinobacter bryozoorum]MCK7545996.1 helix-turn-helix domain-containing protein [Marinobacter bryozoorum]